MKIGFVAEPYEEKNASGMGYVVLELIENLLKQGKEHEFIIYSSRPFKKERLVLNAKNVIIPISFLGKFFWFLKNCRDLDVLMHVAPLLPIIAPKSVKTVLVCQELASQKIKPKGVKEKIKAFWRDRILTPIVFKRASVIVAASNATKDDLLRFYKINEKKIKVIYDGFQDLKIYADEDDKCGENLIPFFFFAGKVKYRKNVHGMVDAFIKFKKKQNSDCKLVIAGTYGGDYYEQILASIKKNNMEGKIIFVGYAIKGKLYSFFKNAAACVFPSINEGFGMPIIEAMSLGAPVITSNISSMIEVAGGASLLVDPFNTDEIAEAMEKVFFDQKLRNELVAKGIERAKSFSWPKAASEYLDLIKNV